MSYCPSCADLLKKRAVLQAENARLKEAIQGEVDVIRRRIFEAESGEIVWVEKIADRLQTAIGWPT